MAADRAFQLYLPIYDLWSDHTSQRNAVTHGVSHSLGVVQDKPEIASYQGHPLEEHQG